jgi:chromosomal replication initiation ATPase DnaA
MADAQPPDLETKMAILDKSPRPWASISLTTCGRLWHQDQSNVRELEGALVLWWRILRSRGRRSRSDGAAGSEEYCSRAGSACDHRFDTKAVAEKFQIKQAQLGKRQHEEGGVPRQVAMYLVKERPTRLPTDRPGVQWEAPYHGLHSIAK